MQYVILIFCILRASKEMRQSLHISCTCFQEISCQCHCQLDRLVGSDAGKGEPTYKIHFENAVQLKRNRILKEKRYGHIKS